jgi:hypothetical protein
MEFFNFVIAETLKITVVLIGFMAIIRMFRS